ncbi:MAG TPA: ArsC/Spx/MgsR family protein [Gemmatimonadaceae bacterium]|nr:ArsC/Spx/MgsR family protein [Gemmatimonadaceae bacterium]
MEVQIFGTRKCADTRKAQRFFSERRVRVHFVDLAERAASRGEITRFVQRFGVLALVDEESRRYADLGLRTARLPDERWLTVLTEEPMLLRTPLVRCQHRLTVGIAESEWASWIVSP